MDTQMKKNFNPNQPGNSFVQLLDKKNTRKSNSLVRYSGGAPDSPFGNYYYPSLWGYYNLLPVQLRNHPFTMAILQGLEKYHYKVGLVG